MGRFREAVEIVHKMWTEDYPEFRGKYYTVDRPINQPRGVRKPHPPIWIGGGGEKVTLRLVAKWGEACNINAPIEVLPHKLDVLKRHCEEVGRNYDDIIKSREVNLHLVERERDAEAETALARGGQSFNEYARRVIVGTPETIRERIQPFMDVGMDYFIVNMPRTAYDLAPQNRFAREVIPLFR
jgi:alkanesulfonate monooxygenase SsuD/methylene tetrahydromethanopterin reductase-like flavin-dependent oxidoreductase (luciferase family)